MTTINANAWQPPLELAVLPSPTPAEAASAPASGRAAGDDGFELFGRDGFTFSDFLDIINPLHHIPVIGTLYRHFSGDEIDPGARVLGGALFFGPLGGVASIGDVLIHDATGKDMGQHVMAMFDEQKPRPSEVADAGGLVVADAGVTVGHAAAATAPESDALDPVTHWAMEELAFRQAVAVKVQSSREFRRDLRERVAAPMPAVAAAYDNSRQALIAAGLAEPTPTPAPRPAGRVMAESTGAAKAQSIIRHTRRSAAMMAAAGYGRADPPAERRHGDRQGEAPSAALSAPSPGTSPGTPPGTPPGAVAPLGGWFSEVMLKAHDRYQAASIRAQDHFPTTLDVRH